MARPTENHRILIVDDNAAIHDDFRKVLTPPRSRQSFQDLEAILFDAAPEPERVELVLEFALQGQQAVEQVAVARAAGQPFALAFVDMRMPPGWNGLETIQRIWEIDREIQIVICSAYSDYPWSELRARLGDSDSLLIIKKPFDPIEILQCAHALTAKWNLSRAVGAHVDELEVAVQRRTAELELANRQLAAEVRERDRLETELRLAQRLETIGELAAGIAHEIATPVQYVGDSLAFLKEGMEDIGAMLERVRCATSMASVIQLVDSWTTANNVRELIDTIDLGVCRITSIVQAMREFAHPGARTPQPADVNRTIRTALAVSACRYTRVAELATDLGALPPVICYESDLAQVIVNLIVNAAHAIEDRGGGVGRLGVATKVDGEDVLIAISDSGCGIPVDVQARIFDPFFTTKKVGRGTGQGLAISRSIVVDRHGGSLTFETAPNLGTKFTIRIPIDGPRSARAA